jgi:hypothetical protein
MIKFNHPFFFPFSDKLIFVDLLKVRSFGIKLKQKEKQNNVLD